MTFDPPGVRDRDLDVTFGCQGPAEYVELSQVLEVMQRVRANLAAVTGSDVSDAVWGLVIRDAIRDADRLEYSELPVDQTCGFDGEAPGVQRGTVIFTDCPLCGYPHEIPAN